VTNQPTGPADRDDGAVARFIENFATVLTESGLPRMPARVFVGLLATDSGRLTAAELAALLQVSPAAVSGAVRYLTQVGMIGRARDPGTRRDQYLVYDDVWYEAILHRDQLLARWERCVGEGVEVLGAGTPAGHRMAETKAFFEFLAVEMPPMLKRWREYRARLPDAPATPGPAARTPARPTTRP
jgi:DNA-binding transcriptional regulator GbsR (MarR family)